MNKDRKREYYSPAISVMQMNSYSLMEGLSMGVSSEPAVGASQAKQWNWYEDDLDTEENNGFQ